MFMAYDTNAPKKPTNLTVNIDLLQKAKDLKINISSVLEYALTEELKKRLETEWKKENRESIKAYNQKIEEIGLFSDGIRTI
jgi:antitoxin CcdA